MVDFIEEDELLELELDEKPIITKCKTCTKWIETEGRQKIITAPIRDANEKYYQLSLEIWESWFIGKPRRQTIYHLRDFPPIHAEIKRLITKCNDIRAGHECSRCHIMIGPDHLEKTKHYQKGRLLCGDCVDRSRKQKT